jgi:dihydropteroate synthase
MFTLNCKGKLLCFREPVVMGILNLTPDSFYAESRQQSIDAVLKRAEKMVNEGAAILDLGGQSTRPGSERISAEAEAARVVPVIESVHYNFPDLLISVDTYFSTVASQAVKAGAVIVNDISGGTFDEQMIPAVAKMKVPFVCTHVVGNPQSMHNVPAYKDVTADVLDFFSRQVRVCREAGIKDIIIDPGIGFSKSIEQNFQLISELELLQILELPVLLGVSRKGTIYRTLGVTAEDALNGTTILNTIGLMNGTAILRVHDVREAKEAIILTGKIKGRYN